MRPKLNGRQPALAENHVLDEVLTLLRRFVSLSNVQARVIALWVAHTHAIDAAYTTPYLSITSAEKQSGKTRLLEVLKSLVRNAWFTGRASAAVLVRKINAKCPTLLLDESDAAFGSDREYTETLRGVLNNGHSRDGVISMCIGPATNIGFKYFAVFCPKAIAGIGSLPDTVADRSIPIRMKRRKLGEQFERFRSQTVRAEAESVRDRLAAWAGQNLEKLRDARPALPDALSDRQQDGAEPLPAIADVAGGDWPQKARTAILDLLTGESAEDQSTGVRLLSAIRDVFDQRHEIRLSTSDLITALCDLDPQWLEFSHGKPLSPAALSRLLKRYGISGQRFRLDDERNLRGYDRHMFEDPWECYLPRNLEQGGNCMGKVPSPDLEQKDGVPCQRIAQSPACTGVVPDVPVLPIGSGLKASAPFSPPTATDLGFQ